MVLVIFLAIGMTAWMSQVPVIKLTERGLTLRNPFGTHEVMFANMASYGMTLGTLYIRCKTGEKINAGMYMYVSRPDRERLLDLLRVRGIPHGEG